jgi:membrane associated rhomboid family serine protease
MGIYDREYYRDETGGSPWLSGITPALKAILAINIAVFLGQWISGDFRAFMNDYLVARSDEILRGGRVWQLITAPFVHENGVHILLNLVFLWMFGREVESIYSSRDFAAMYLTAAAASTLGWALVDAFLLHSHGPMIGASGAVFAVFVIYALYYWRREVLLFFVLPVPIWAVLAVAVGWDLLMLLVQIRGEAGGRGFGSPDVAYAAHLGGALYGYLFKTYDLRWSHLGRLVSFRPRLKVFNPPTTRAERRTPSRSVDMGRPGATPPASTSTSVRPTVSVVFAEDQLDERLDEILAKIAQEGRGSLTEDENRVLLEASRRAKLKRTPK